MGKAVCAICFHKPATRSQLDISGKIPVIRKLMLLEKGLEHLAITGKIEGKRSKSRQRMTFMERLKSWAIGKGSNNNFMRLAENKFE
ncbi:hypothetical protein PoB_003533200 [Plakobranchus ocellatus]|uniref:Uncharacterized protein n=1 Tax=Plakobranchus ocellatus TaxID=259542 RepID=A0AAV4ANI1_9GAST|nr:hypothetical protein PoB_003533200 [Plakobranchus ocellatus]